MSRAWFGVLAVMVLVLGAGCHCHSCQLRGGDRSGIGCNPGCRAGLGCGERYWGDWYAGRARLWDPCDWCGNYTGDGAACGMPVGYHGPMMTGGGYSVDGLQYEEFVDEGMVIEHTRPGTSQPTMAPPRSGTPTVAPQRSESSSSAIGPSARKTTAYRHSR